MGSEMCIRDRNEETRVFVETEVRRVLSQGELEVRKNIADEIASYRNFLQSQFRTITWGVGILFAVAGIVFVFLFGKSYESANSQIVQEVDSKVIEYRIVEAYKERLEAQVSIILESDKTKSSIEQSVENSVSSVV